MHHRDHRRPTRAALRPARRLLFVAALLLAPRAAHAHAHLKRSDPAAKATLAAAPSAIRLWFTEEPELRLTTMRLTDSAGTTIAVGAPAHEGSDVFSARFTVPGTLAPGLWTVSWKTAALDGHPSSGSFTFRIAPSAAAAAPLAPPAPPVAASAVRRSPGGDTAQTGPSDADALTPLYVIARTLSFVALLALIGAATFRYGVMPRVMEWPGASEGAIARGVATGAAMAALGYLVAAALRLSLQNRMMTGDPMADAVHMRSMAMETHWGAVWRLQCVAAAVALAGALVARAGRAPGWALLALSGGTLALAAALGGHAAAAPAWRTLSVVDDTLHVIAAAGWLGSLLWVVVVGLPALQRAEGERARRIAALVHAFSPVALGFAALVGVTGVVSAWLRLGTLPALWTSGYGQALLLKLALLACVVVAGFYNWRAVRPTLGTDVATVRLQRSSRAELAFGLLVLLATAVLVAMPTPLPPG